jgi:hypothetical protein
MFALQCTLCKPTLFFKCKPNDIRTNVFSIHGRRLWEINTYAQFILDPYVVVACCISYLTKVDKYVTHEMQHILNKYNYKKIETSERIKKLGNAFFNVQ